MYLRSLSTMNIVRLGVIEIVHNAYFKLCEYSYSWAFIRLHAHLNFPWMSIVHSCSVSIMARPTSPIPEGAALKQTSLSMTIMTSWSSAEPEWERVPL